MKVEASRKNIGSAIFLINCVVALFVFVWLYFMGAMDYIQMAGSTFGAIYLISIVIASNKYVLYFQKHCRIYRAILAVAFLFLTVAFLARPTYYFVIVIVGLTGFNFTLAILMIVIHDQNESKQNLLKT